MEPSDHCKSGELCHFRFTFVSELCPYLFICLFNLKCFVASTPQFILPTFPVAHYLKDFGVKEKEMLPVSGTSKLSAVSGWRTEDSNPWRKNPGWSLRFLMEAEFWFFFSFHEALLTFTPVNLSVCLLARVWRLLRQEVRGGRQTFSVSGGGLRWWGSQSGADISRKTFFQSYVHTVTPGQRGLTQQPGAEWRNVMIII